MIDKMSEFIENKIAPPLTKLSANRYLDSIQKTFITLMPLIIAGSFFVLMAALPFDSWQKLISPIVGKLWGFNNSTMGLLTFGIALGMGYFLSEHYKNKDEKIDPFSGAIISLFSFLILFPLADDPNVGLHISATYFGSTGIFTAIFVSIITIEIYRFIIKKNIVIRMPEGVPPMVTNAFTVLIPSFIVFLLWWVLNSLLELNIPELFLTVFSPIVSAGKNVFTQGFGFLLDRLLWFVGIHGSNVVNSVMSPIWIDMLAANTEAIQQGKEIPYIASEQFLNYFVRVSPLPLIILMLVSKAKHFKTLGKLALPASIFNIAEPIMFGLPLILNPLLFIPWVLGYMIIFIFSYVVIASGLVPAPYIQVPWTVPGPIAAYLGTGGSLSAGALSLLNYFIMFFIWYPFFKVFSKKQYENEMNQS